MAEAQKKPVDATEFTFPDEKDAKDENKEEYLLATITPLKILPYTYETSQLAGEIARDLKSPIEFADAAIAATSILFGASFLTLNKKHFTGIRELVLV